MSRTITITDEDLAMLRPIAERSERWWDSWNGKSHAMNVGPRDRATLIRFLENKLGIHLHLARPTKDAVKRNLPDCGHPGCEPQQCFKVVSYEAGTGAKEVFYDATSRNDGDRVK